MPYPLRQLFATLLVYSQVSNVRGLWDQFYDELSADFERQLGARHGQEVTDNIMFFTLKSIDDLLKINGVSLDSYNTSLPQLSDFPTLLVTSEGENNLIRRELEGYTRSVLQDVADHNGDLNEGQRAIYDQVVGAVETPEVGKKLFFVDGPGGTGKSTLIKHILANVRLSGKIAIASSGIASLLLMGGRTAHSTFKISLKLDEKSTCSVTKQSHLRALIQRDSLIIWDEAPMTHRHAFEAVVRTLRDVMNNDNEQFGGKVLVLSGDFRQILPVVIKGTPAETIDACLKSSQLWPYFQQVRLTENMRVRTADNDSSAEEIAAFSEFLLQVGEGRHEVNPALGGNFMKIPRDMLIDNPPADFDADAEIAPGAVPIGMKRMIDTMYADVNDPTIATDEYFANRTILTTTNAMVHRINEAVGAGYNIILTQVCVWDAALPVDGQT